jgi:hypothetical protein
MITPRTVLVPEPFGLSAPADISRVRAVPYGDDVLPVTEAAEVLVVSYIAREEGPCSSTPIVIGYVLRSAVAARDRRRGLGCWSTRARRPY